MEDTNMTNGTFTTQSSNKNEEQVHETLHKKETLTQPTT